MFAVFSTVGSVLLIIAASVLIAFATDTGPTAEAAATPAASQCAPGDATCGSHSTLAVNSK